MDGKKYINLNYHDHSQLQGAHEIYNSQMERYNALNQQVYPGPRGFDGKFAILMRLIIYVCSTKSI